MTERLTESQFMGQVVELAALFGFASVHFRPAQTSRGWRTPVQGPLGKGWPDLVLVRDRDGRLIFAELKDAKGKLSAEQVQVLDILRTTPAEVYVWRPADIDAIAELLR